MSPERERTLSGEWDIENSPQTGPVRPHTCNFHQGQVVAVALLKDRLDNVRQEITEMKADIKEGHLAMMQAITEQRDATKATFKAQQEAIEGLRSVTQKNSMRLAIIIAGAATVGSGLMTLLVKHFGG